jgi:group I intron endonuclease
MPNTGVYKIECSENGKFYIGSAINFDDRFYRHKNDLLKNKHFNRHLQSCFNKYGVESFIFAVLETCELSDLYIKEQFYLDQFFRTPLCVNVAEKAKAPPSSKGVKRSEETCKKIGDIHRGKNL